MTPICFCGFPLVQCLTNVLLAGSPFPSHPTGRSVFPSPAVRQSSSHLMRRLSVVLDDSTPDVDHPPGIQSRIRVFLPPEASAFTAIVQVAAKANVDESLQVPKRVACIGVTIVINPSPYRLIPLFRKLCGLNLCPPLREALDLPSDPALRGLARMGVDARLAARG